MDIESEILDIFIRLQEHSDILRYQQANLPEGIGLTEVHCLDCIGREERRNVTKIADQLGLTRAGVSKANKRLLGKDLIESYRDDNNKKEIYFRLTKQGQAVFKEHENIHDRVRKEWLDFLSDYGDSEKKAILRFFSEINGLYAKKEKNDD
jgi:DNA-binding MarR family transcriptional regulator